MTADLIKLPMGSEAHQAMPCLYPKCLSQLQVLSMCTICRVQCCQYYLYVTRVSLLLAAGFASSRAVDAIKLSTKALEERLRTLEHKFGEKADGAVGNQAGKGLLVLLTRDSYKCHLVS